jgi:hypothetical protein
MEEVFHEDETYDKIDFKENSLKKGDYENRKFINCDLSGKLNCQFAGQI